MVTTDEILILYAITNFFVVWTWIMFMFPSVLLIEQINKKSSFKDIKIFHEKKKRKIHIDRNTDTYYHVMYHLNFFLISY